MEAGIVCTESFGGACPAPSAAQPAGRRAPRYLEHMEALIRATRER
jgi:hypothetical protein